MLFRALLDVPIEHGKLCGTLFNDVLKGICSSVEACPDGADETRDFYIQRFQKLTENSARRNARRRFPRRRTLQNISCVRDAEFFHACKISVTGAHVFDYALFRVATFGCHKFLPILIIAVPYRQRYGTTERRAIANAGENFRFIAFDFLPCAPSVTALTPEKLPVNFFKVDYKPLGNPFDDCKQSFAVRFPRCC